ncbi:MAG: TM0996/MTH895 family glutaredoxin-like protein [Deltaproteobacteria bacterium]|jgi:small redox-active disulfide protein 2|nr:TM0996/MTH895 family glutaredoxin-like protein [Deltaproteobacteria bacterium]
MKIKVLGTGCTRCNTAEAVVKEAVAISGVEAQVIKVKDIKEIAKYAVAVTPGIIVDGQIKSVGKVPSVEEVLNWIREVNG